MIINLKTLLLALILMSTTYTTSAVAIEARIIGGIKSDPSSWPWMAGMVIKHKSAKTAFCGASLIAPYWVLTAAHCVETETTATFDIIINQPRLDVKTGERIAVERIITHPDYNNKTLKNDLALIKLQSPSKIMPVQLLAPFSVQDSPQKTALALGFGALSFPNNTFPLDLQQVALPIISNALCSVSDGVSINDTQICAGDRQGEKDTCSGDSGGPLIVFDTESRNWKQVGVTSYGIGCAQTGFYGVYTRLKSYANFISQQICTPLIPPHLSLSVTGNTVNASWNRTDANEGYRLNYAPYPNAETIYSIDMNNLSEFSVQLNTKSAFYVAITRYQGNCLSEYSNIEHFVIQ